MFTTDNRKASLLWSPLKDTQERCTIYNKMNIDEIPRKELEDFYVKQNKEKIELIESVFNQLTSFTGNLNLFFLKNNMPFKLNIELREKVMDSIIGEDFDEDMILPKSF